MANVGSHLDRVVDPFGEAGVAPTTSPVGSLLGGSPGAGAGQLSMFDAMTLQTPQLVPRDGGVHYHFLNHLMTTKVSAEQTGGALTAMEFVGPRGFGPPLHRHDVEDELFYVVEGEVWFECGDAEAVHTAGATVWLPRGRAHTFQIRSEEARVFQITTPGRFDRFVAALGSPIPSVELPDPTEIDPEHVARVAAEHDIEILGPPPEPLE